MSGAGLAIAGSSTVRCRGSGKAPRLVSGGTGRQRAHVSMGGERSLTCEG